MKKRVIKALGLVVALSMVGCGGQSAKGDTASEAGSGTVAEEDVKSEDEAGDLDDASDISTDNAAVSDSEEDGEAADSESSFGENKVVSDVLEEGETNIVLDDGIEVYEGSWHEEVAGRGSMEVEPSGNGKYYIQVDWGSSAWETATWIFTAIYDSETGDLYYDDGEYKLLEFSEDGSETVKDEKRVQGVIHATEDGKLEWTDSAFEDDEPSVFVRN